MSEPSTVPPVRLAERFASSERFRALFASGMDLVEETACYLDGEGRREAKAMDRRLGALYGTESMRLTTRLMQLASWLLLQRSVVDGEMTRADAMAEKEKVKLAGLPSLRTGEWDRLPEAFRSLVDRSAALQRRVISLDAEIYGDEPAEPARPNPVLQQVDLLHKVFDR